MRIRSVLLPYIYISSIVLCYSCHHSKRESPLFELVENTGIVFNNVVKDGKSDNSFVFRNFYNGGGVAIGDINNDGLPDVLLTSNMGDNKLYLNKGNFKFDDITGKTGFRQDSMWSTGVVFVDINNDGWLDIYICNSGNMSNGNRRNKLYINNHDLTFTEEAARYGLAISAYTTQVTFFDYDGDGDLDCFMINNSPIPVNTLNNANHRDLPDSAWPVASFLKGGGDHLFRNDNGHFTEVTQQAGIHGSLISFGLGAMVADINGDGRPDIYVSNDSYERDYLYINQGNGTFKDETDDWISHMSMSSMGTDMADINNDGYPDLFTTDMLPDDDYRLKTTGSFDNINLFNSKLRSDFSYQYVKNCLQLNNKNGKFLEIGNYSGVSASDWSWGALLFDADNDGYNDIYICNGVNRDVTDLDFLNFFADDVFQKMALSHKKENIDELLKKIPQHPLLNKVFRNKGNLQFEDIGRSWGFVQPSFSNGAAYGDLDNDGDLDLVVNNENQPAFVYRNNSREINHNNYIGLFLKGKSPNTFAIGSKIRIYQGHQIFYRELIPSRGFQSSMDYKQIIGLGSLTTIDSMNIIWPDGTITHTDHPAINKVDTIQQTGKEATPAPSLPQAPPPPLLTALQSPFDRHQEDDNEDFNFERNLPKMLSREGPKATCGDVDGDGLIDLFIAGAAQHPGQLYRQTPSGSFTKTAQPAFDQFIDFEDGAVLLFDADHDGDLDLFIGPAGNNNQAFSRQMQFRLFLNDGKGHFTLDPEAFQPITNGVNTSVAVAGDFNGDGYQDLFIGGRSIPREYGTPPASFLYINDGKGHFTDMAPAKNPDIAHIGMVTSALWTDITGDGKKELIITGDWMTPHIFSFSGDHFTSIKTNLDQLSGWWQNMAVADLNGDGRPDLVLGNIGENFYLHPDSAHPVKLWVSDFDQNGIKDKVLSRTIDGKDMPVFLKHEMEDQIPSLKKQNLKHAAYAKKTIQELFPPPLLDSAQIQLFNYTSSIVAINNGNGQFTIRKLPAQVQFSSVNAIHCIDINGDGSTDLVLGGNEFGFLPQFGRLDASFGHVLLNDGKGYFTELTPDRSGLQLSGQIRDIAEIPGKDQMYLLFLRNNEFPALYSCPSFHNFNAKLESFRPQAESYKSTTAKPSKIVKKN